MSDMPLDRTHFDEIEGSGLGSGASLGLRRHMGNYLGQSVEGPTPHLIRAVLAALIPGVNIVKVLLIGLGIWKDDATVKSMSRYGDYRQVLIECPVIGYMHYFSMFGCFEESWQMIFGFLVVSIASALVESHPISTKFDDNLMVPLTSLLLGALVF